MREQKPTPGISRDNRLSDDGLDRLRRQLASGIKISQPVLLQWVKRYGEEARTIIEQHGVTLSE